MTQRQLIGYPFIVEIANRTYIEKKCNQLVGYYYNYVSDLLINTKNITTASTLKTHIKAIFPAVMLFTFAEG